MNYRYIFRWLLIFPAGIIGWVAGDFASSLLFNVSIWLNIKLVWPFKYFQPSVVVGYNFVLLMSYCTAVFAAGLASPRDKQLSSGIVFGFVLLTYRSFMTYQRFIGSEFTPDSPSTYLVGSVFCFLGVIIGLLAIYVLKIRKKSLNYFIDYCRSYCIDVCKLSYEDAQLLILDPELGPPMDEVKSKWAWKVLQASEDPDEILKMKDYYSPRMQPINRLLDEYRNQFEKRKSIIKDYLKSIGHPFSVD